MSVTTHTSVAEFFHEVVVDALQSARVDASEDTECYLVNLLGEFASAQITDEPLSLKLAQAQDDPAQRVKVLKEVGDTSLYVTGFFAASLHRQLVGSGYYISLGKAAYHELSGRLAGGSTVGEVYGELAEKFPRFVDVLTEVRKRVSFAGTDVASLYEQWLATRAEWIERRLRALGVLMPPPDSDEGLLH